MRIAGSGKKKRLIGEAALLMAALLWGFSWVAQKFGAMEVTSFTFVAVRCFFATFILWIVADVRRTKGLRQGPSIFSKAQATTPKAFWIDLALMGASSLSYTLGIVCQQETLLHLEVGTTAFITAAYVVLLPIVEVVLLKQKVPRNVWLAVALAMVGLYFLSIEKNMEINKWSFLALAGALCWVVQVTTIDRVVARHDCIEVTFALFLFSFILGTLGMYIFDGGPDFPAIVRAIFPLIYCGFIGGALAFGLQIYGQQFTPPSLAGIFLSTEGLFAPLTALLILGELMSGRKLMGGLIMFAGVIVSQIPSKATRGGSRAAAEEAAVAAAGEAAAKGDSQMAAGDDGRAASKGGDQDH